MTITNEEIIARHDPSVRGRALIEVKVIHELIKRLLADGWTLFVDDGDDELQDCDGDPQTMVTAIFAVDVATLHARKDGKNRWVQLVMGNDGTDVISDYHTGLDPIIDPLQDWIEEGKYAAS